MNEEIEKLRSALWSCATQAVALKQPCSDPDSPQAFRNAKYQAISTTAHIALGTITGQAVSLSELSRLDDYSDDISVFDQIDSDDDDWRYI